MTSCCCPQKTWFWQRRCPATTPNPRLTKAACWLFCLLPIFRPATAGSLWDVGWVNLIYLFCKLTAFSSKRVVAGQGKLNVPYFSSIVFLKQFQGWKKTWYLRMLVLCWGVAAVSQTRLKLPLGILNIDFGCSRSSRETVCRGTCVSQMCFGFGVSPL